MVDHPRIPRLKRSDWFPWLEGQDWYKSDAPPHGNYATAVQNLLQPRQARADFFRQLLETSLAPSAGYDKLAEFLALGFIPIVLTTNFDSLLPEMRVLKRRPHYIDVIQTPSDYTKFSTSPQHPQLVYLHGSVDHYTDKNIENEVQKLDEKLVEMLFPLLRDHPLIVVGYRGGEPSVMQHLLLQNADRANGYPPNRGTLCSVNDASSYLFTTGYMQELHTYPGPHIPAPVEIRSDRAIDIERASREILGLARMNWNTASITGGQPVTLRFARQVGGIMAEYGQTTQERPLTSFRYYM